MPQSAEMPDSCRMSQAVWVVTSSMGHITSGGTSAPACTLPPPVPDTQSQALCSFSGHPQHHPKPSRRVQLMKGACQLLSPTQCCWLLIPLPSSPPLTSLSCTLAP